MRQHFILSAFLFLVAICAAAFFSGFPIAPFALITIVAELLFGLHLNHDRPLRFLRVLAHALKSDHRARMRHAH
jgi:hypothetical protein